jgi:hypothetical protein
MKRLTIVVALLCAVAFSRDIIGTYERLASDVDSGRVMSVYRDSSGSIHTRLDAVGSLAERLPESSVMLGDTIGSAPLVAFRLDREATKRQHERAFTDQTVYKAVLLKRQKIGLYPAVSVLYGDANSDAPEHFRLGSLLVAQGDGPPFDPNKVIEIWGRIDTLPRGRP